MAMRVPPGLTWGRVWKIGLALYKFGYVVHNNKTYRKLYVKHPKKAWAATGLVFVLVSAARWTPVSGFSWLFRMRMR